MTIEGLQKICKKLKGVTEDIKWENHLCFNVGDKMFLVTAPDYVPQSASFKASDEDFEDLTSKEGFIPAPYMARYKWVHVDDIKRLSQKEWEHYAAQSYQQVAAKLPKKVREKIGLK
jgi:predicted DNA-binding protein (MmcQ/YjbR family)